MTLDEYLTNERLTESAFAAKIGVSQPHVGRIRKGRVWPQKDTMERILIVTGGRVTPNDFLSDAGGVRA